MPAKTPTKKQLAAAGTDDGLDALMTFIEGPGEGEDDDEEGVSAADASIEDLIEGHTPGENEDGGEDEGAAVGDPARAPAVATAPAATGAPVATPDALTRITELADRLAVAEVQRQEREQQAADAAERTRREAEAAASAPRAPFADEDLTLTPEETTTYGVSRPTIEKIGKAAVRGYHDQVVKPLLDRINQLETKQTETTTTAARATDQATMAALRTSVPDLDSRVKSPEWQGYIAAPMRALGPGVTRGMVLQQALARGDIEAAAEIISAFEKPAAVTPPAAGATPGRSGTGAPASVAAAARRGKEGKVYPYSRFTALAEQAKRGQLAPDKFQEVSDFYMQKYEEGLVDMNS